MSNENNICNHCKKRKIEPKIDFYTHKLCKKCFSNIIDKRIRKYIRVNKILNAKDHICIINDESSSGYVTEYIIKELSLKIPLKITVRKKINQNIFEKYDKIIVPINMDQYTDNFFNELFFGDVANFYIENSNRKIKSILKGTTDKECFYFEKFNQLGKSKLNEHVIDNFEMPYPETKFATVKSINLIEKILK